jgi:hypothetical protein
MPLFDKVKEQAAQAAQKAQEAAQRGQDKIEEAQAKRREDALLRDLGAAVYAERTGTAGADSAAEIDRLVADITAHRDEHAEAVATAAATGASPSAAPEGDFKLE